MPTFSSIMERINAPQQEQVQSPNEYKPKDIGEFSDYVSNDPEYKKYYNKSADEKREYINRKKEEYENLSTEQNFRKAEYSLLETEGPIKDEQDLARQSNESFSNRMSPMSNRVNEQEIVSQKGSLGIRYTDASFLDTVKRSLIKGLGEHVIGSTGDILQYITGDFMGDGTVASRALQDWGYSMAENNKVFIPEELKPENLTWGSMLNPEFWSIHFAQYIPQIAEFILLSKGGSAALKGGVRNLASLAGTTGRVAEISNTGARLAGMAEDVYTIGKGRGIASILTESGKLTKNADFWAGTIGGGITSNLATGLLNTSQEAKRRRDSGLYTEEQIKEMGSDMMMNNLWWLGVDMLSWGMTFNGGWKGLGKTLNRMTTVPTEVAKRGMINNFVRKSTSFLGKASFEGAEEMFQETYEDWTAMKAAENVFGEKAPSYFEYFMSDEARATKIIAFSSGLGGGAYGNIKSLFEDIDENAERDFALYNRTENLKSKFKDEDIEGREMKRFHIEDTISDMVINGREDLIPEMINEQFEKGFIKEEEAQQLIETSEVYMAEFQKAKDLNVKGKYAYLDNIRQMRAHEITLQQKESDYNRKINIISQDKNMTSDEKKIANNNIHQEYKLQVKALLNKIAINKSNLASLSIGGKAVKTDETKSFMLTHALGTITNERKKRLKEEGYTPEEIDNILKQTKSNVYNDPNKNEEQTKIQEEGMEIGLMENRVLPNGQIINEIEEYVSKSDEQIYKEALEKNKKDASKSIPNRFKDWFIEKYNSIVKKEDIDEKDEVIKKTYDEFKKEKEKTTPNVNTGENEKTTAEYEETLKKEYEIYSKNFDKEQEQKKEQKQKQQENKNTISSNSVSDTKIVEDSKEPSKLEKEEYEKEIITSIQKGEIPRSVLIKIADKINANEELTPLEKGIYNKRGKKSFKIEIDEIAESRKELTEDEKTFIKSIENNEKESLENANKNEKVKKTKKPNEKPPNLFGGKKQKTENENRVTLDDIISAIKSSQTDIGEISDQARNKLYSAYKNMTMVRHMYGPDVATKMLVYNQRLKELFPGSFVSAIAVADMYDAIGVNSVGYALGTTLFINENKWDQGTTMMHEMTHLFYISGQNTEIVKRLTSIGIKNGAYDKIKSIYFEDVLYKTNNEKILTAQEIIDDYTGNQDINENQFKEIIKKLVDDKIIIELPTEQQEIILEETFVASVEGPLSKEYNNFFESKNEAARQFTVKKFWQSLKRNGNAPSNLISNERIAELLLQGKSIPNDQLKDFFVKGFKDAIQEHVGNIPVGKGIGFRSYGRKQKIARENEIEEINNKIIESQNNKKNSVNSLQVMTEKEATEHVLFLDEEEAMTTMFDLSFEQRPEYKKTTKHLNAFIKKYNKLARRINIEKGKTSKSISLLKRDEFLDELSYLARTVNSASEFIYTIENSNYKEFSLYNEYLDITEKENKYEKLSSMWAVYHNLTDVTSTITRIVDGEYSIENSLSKRELTIVQQILGRLKDIKNAWEDEKKNPNKNGISSDKFKKFELFNQAIQKIQKGVYTENDLTIVYNMITNYYVSHRLKLNNIIAINGQEHTIQTVIESFIKNNLHLDKSYNAKQDPNGSRAIMFINPYNFKPLVDAIINTNRRYKYSSTVKNAKNNSVPNKEIKNMITREIEMIKEELQRLTRNNNPISKYEFLKKFSHILSNEKGSTNKLLGYWYDNYQKTGQLPSLIKDNGTQTKTDGYTFDENTKSGETMNMLSKFIASNGDMYHQNISVFGNSPRSFYVPSHKYGKEYINGLGELTTLGKKTLEESYKVYLSKNNNNNNKTFKLLSKEEYFKEAMDNTYLEQLLLENRKKIQEINIYKDAFLKKGEKYELTGKFKNMLKAYKLSSIVNTAMLDDIFNPTLNSTLSLKYTKTSISPAYTYNKNLKITPLFFNDIADSTGSGQVDGMQFITPESAERISRSAGSMMELNNGFKLLNNSIERKNKYLKNTNIYKSYTTILDDEYVKQNPKYKGLRELMKKQEEKYAEYHRQKYKTEQSQFLSDNLPNNIVLAIPHTSVKTAKSIIPLNLSGVNFNETITLEGLNDETNFQNAEKYFQELHWEGKKFIGVDGYNLGVQMIMDKITKTVKTPVQLIDSLLVNAMQNGELETAEKIQSLLSEVMLEQLDPTLKKISGGTVEQLTKLIKKEMNSEAMDQRQRYMIETYGILSPMVNTIVTNQLANSIKNKGNKLFTTGSYSQPVSDAGYVSQKYHKTSDGSDIGLNDYVRVKGQPTRHMETLLPKHMENEIIPRQVITKEHPLFVNRKIPKEISSKNEITQSWTELDEMYFVATELAKKTHKNANNSNINQYVTRAYDDFGNHVGYFVKGETVVATRVPSSGPNSTLLLECVGFNNSEGNQIMLPKEYKLYTGGDFDGDSIFIQTKKNINPKINKVLQMIEDLWLKESMYDSITAKVDLEEVGTITKEIQKIFNKDQKSFIPGSPEQMAFDFENTLTAKKNIGSVFNIHKMIGILAAYNTPLVNGISINNKKYSNYYDFIDPNNKQNNRNILSGRIANIIMDNLKLQQASILGFDENTMSAVMQLVNLGIPLKEISIIMNHPIVVEMSTKLGYNNSVYFDDIAASTITDSLKKGKRISSETINVDPTSKAYLSDENTNAILDLMKQLGESNMQMQKALKILTGYKGIETNSIVLAQQIKDYNSFMNNTMENAQFIVPRNVRENKNNVKLLKVAETVLEYSKKVNFVHNPVLTNFINNLSDKISTDGFTPNQMYRHTKNLEVFLNARLMGLNNIPKETIKKIITPKLQNEIELENKLLKQNETPIEKNVFQEMQEYLDSLSRNELNSNLLLTQALNMSLTGNSQYIGINKTFFDESITDEEFKQIENEFENLPEQLKSKMIIYDLSSHGWSSESTLSSMFGYVNHMLEQLRNIEYNKFNGPEISNDTLKDLEKVMLSIEMNTQKSSLYKLYFNEKYVYDKNNLMNSLFNKPVLKKNMLDGKPFYFVVNVTKDNKTIKQLRYFRGLNEKQIREMNNDNDLGNKKSYLVDFIEKVDFKSSENEKLDLIAIPDASTGSPYLDFNNNSNVTGRKQKKENNNVNVYPDTTSDTSKYDNNIGQIIYNNIKEKYPDIDVIFSDSPLSYDGNPLVLLQISEKLRKEFNATLTKKRRDLAEKNQVEEQLEHVQTFIDTFFPNSQPTVEKTIAISLIKWLSKSNITLPEDNERVSSAIKIGLSNRINLMGVNNPNDLFELEYKEPKTILNPDNISEFKNKKTLANGVVVYDIDNNKAGQLALRKVQDSHFGEKNNSWCISARGENGSLDKAFDLWQNKYGGNKKVAFQHGKLIAFKAEKDGWADKQDNVGDGIPITRKIEGDNLKRKEKIRIDENIGLKIEGEKIFKGNPNEGLYEEWYSLDIKKLEQRIVNGKKEGIKRQWRENGQLESEIEYQNDYRNGIERYWYENGRLKSEIEYKNEKKEGIERYWHENGQLQYGIEYQNGKRDSISHKWYKNGQLDSEIEYKNNEIIERYWNENGQLLSEKKYKNGGRESIKRHWFENGQLEFEIEYQNRKENGIERYWYKNGRLKSEIEYKNEKENGIARYWYENGKLLSKVEYKNGKKDGIQYYWNVNGKLSSETEYKNGEKDGIEYYWHENGKLNFKTEYKYGVKHGIELSWHENGQLKSKIEYQNGKKDNIKYYSHENGQLDSEMDGDQKIIKEFSNYTKLEHKQSLIDAKITSEKYYKYNPSNSEKYINGKKYNNELIKELLNTNKYSEKDFPSFNKNANTDITLSDNLSTQFQRDKSSNLILGMADLEAGRVLIDAVNQRQDTLPHEYAHHYISWFKDTPIVQEGIKRFGSEEELVQAIGEQSARQKGDAYNWWKKFTKWILDILSDKELLQILTDSFLNRVDLRNDFTYDNSNNQKQNLNDNITTPERLVNRSNSNVTGRKQKEEYWEYSSPQIMSAEEYATAMEFDNNVNEYQRKVLYNNYLEQKNEANILSKRITEDKIKQMTDEQLFENYNIYGTKEAYAYAIITRPLIIELTKRMTDHQSALTNRYQNGKDIGLGKAFLMANNIPSNHPAVGGLLRNIEKMHKEFSIEKSKYTKRISKVTDELYKSKYKFSPAHGGIINTIKKFYYAFLNDRAKLYNNLYGNLIETFQYLKDDGTEVQDIRMKSREVIEDNYKNGIISKEEYNFYNEFTSITNELKEFTLSEKQKSATGYIPHTEMNTFEMLYNRGVLGLISHAKTETEHLEDVKIYWDNPNGKRELIRFGDFKNNYFMLSKVSGKNINNIKEYVLGLVRAKKYLKLNKNEDGSNITYTDLEAKSALGLVDFYNRFGNERSSKAVESPSMDLNMAISQYVHSTLFVNGNKNIKGFKGMIPLIDGVLAHNQLNKFKNINKYVKGTIKDFILQGKKQSTFGPLGDKALKGAVFANLLYLLGYKALIATQGLYVIGNIINGKYQNLTNGTYKGWVTGEKRYWGLDKSLSSISEIMKRKKRSRNILSTIGFMNVNLLDDLKIKTSGELDSFVTNIALMPMEWSENWIQGVQALGLLTDEEYERFDDNGEYKPGAIEISSERVIEIEEQVKQSQGKGYQVSDQRLIQMYSWGEAIMQFNKFIPTMLTNQFAREDVNIYGNKHIGSLRAVGQGLGKAITEMDPKAFIAYRNSLDPELRARFDSGLKGIGLSALALLVANQLQSETASQAFFDANYYANTDSLIYKSIPSVARTTTNITGIL